MSRGIQRPRLDANHTAVVEALARIPDCFVQSLAVVGAGCPDIMVLHRSVVHLFEIKDGDKTPSQIELTDPEKRWHKRAKQSGVQVTIIHSPEAAVVAVLGYGKEQDK